jgi:hypothetical protein
MVSSHLCIWYKYVGYSIETVQRQVTGRLMNWKDFKGSSCGLFGVLLRHFPEKGNFSFNNSVALVVALDKQ